MPLVAIDSDMKKPIRTNRILTAVAGFLGMSLLALPLYGQDDQSRLQELQSQLQEYELRLQEVQQEAMDEPEVQEARESFQGTLDDAMAEIDSSATEYQTRKDELYEELVDMGPYDGLSEEDQATYQGMVQEYQQVDSQLQTLADQAMSEPEVQEARSEFQDILIGEMRSIDGSIDDLLDAREEAYQEFQEIQQGMTRPMGPQGQPGG